MVYKRFNNVYIITFDALKARLIVTKLSTRTTLLLRVAPDWQESERNNDTNLGFVNN